MKNTNTGYGYTQHYSPDAPAWMRRNWQLAMAWEGRTQSNFMDGM